MQFYNFTTTLARVKEPELNENPRDEIVILQDYCLLKNTLVKQQKCCACIFAAECLKKLTNITACQKSLVEN